MKRRPVGSVERLGRTYNEVLRGMRGYLDDADRTISSTLLVLYPDRDGVAATVTGAITELGVDAIEVQAMIGGKQITLAAIPDGGAVHIVIPDRNSLCSLSVGADETLAIDNIAGCDFLEDHPAVAGPWNAWCAAPIHIFDNPAGTVCALDRAPHKWSDNDKQTLKTLANLIGSAVETWSNTTDKEPL